MKVYRIQDDAGIGFYRSYYWRMDGKVTINHPTPDDDAKLCMVYEDIGRTDWLTGKSPVVRYGFATLTQMRQWVYKEEWRIAMHKHGFKVHVLDAEQAWAGDTQAMYMPHNVTTLEILSIKDAFNRED